METSFINDFTIKSWFDSSEIIGRNYEFIRPSYTKRAIDYYQNQKENGMIFEAIEFPIIKKMEPIYGFLRVIIRHNTAGNIIHILVLRYYNIKIENKSKLDSKKMKTITK
jgi:hypothetical protein